MATDLERMREYFNNRRAEYRVRPPRFLSETSLEAIAIIEFRALKNLENGSRSGLRIFLIETES